MNAAPMCANWTRCSGRTSTLAPASSSRNGLPGTGTMIASAGRCTPRARLKVNSEDGERRAGGAAADQRVGLPRRHGGDGAHDRGLRRAPDGPGRIGLLGDRDRRVDDRDALGHGPDLGGGAEQEYADATRGSAGGTASDLSGAQVGPVDVYRDGDCDQ